MKSEGKAFSTLTYVCNPGPAPDVEDCKGVKPAPHEPIVSGPDSSVMYICRDNQWMKHTYIKNAFDLRDISKFGWQMIFFTSGSGGERPILYTKNGHIANEFWEYGAKKRLMRTGTMDAQK